MMSRMYNSKKAMLMAELREHLRRNRTNWRADGVCFGRAAGWYMHFDEDSQIAFGSPEQVVLAMHCEQLSPADKKEKRTYPSKYANAILCVEPELYDTNKDVKKSVDNCLKEGVEIVFDCRDVECPVTIGTDRRLHYHGEITERLAMSIAKTMFSTSVNRIWSQSFIVSKSSRSKLPQGMCVVFANLLMLDGDTVQLPTGSGSGSAFKGEIADIMSSAVFDSSKLSEKAGTVLDSVQLFRDYAALWNKAMDDYRFALRLEERDLVHNLDEVKRTLANAAEVINMPDYIATWKMGIPVEDIVA